MKKRLDELLIERGLVSSIKEAHGYICAGRIFVAKTCSDKPGNLHPEEAEISIKGLQKYVSRGGLKLEKALREFKVPVDNAVCVDVGASSGGFTDCLLQHGAGHVFAVDVAYGQFSWKLRQDKRVTVIERFNARNISKKEIVVPLDLAVIDASFISLTKLLPPLLPLFQLDINILALIKPQFELVREKVSKGGVVKEAKLHNEAIEKVISYASSHLGLVNCGCVESPIQGPKGNREYIIHLTRIHGNG